MRAIVILSGLAVVGGVLAACLTAADAPPKRIARHAPTEPTRPNRADDEQAIRQVAEAVAEAYNAKDARAFTALLTADAEIVDVQGHSFHGQEAIAGVFSGVFKQFPQSRMKIEIDKIRFLGPTVAMEEGTARVQHQQDTDAEPARYQVLYVKQDGQWLVASTRDLWDDEQAAATELERLGWLVGSWVDESPEALITTTYHWADNNKYLIGEFSMRVHGQAALAGTERIGWDPLAKKLRSWVFDSDGGFAEGLWTREGQQWVLKLSGVTRDGHVGSATSVYQPQGSDKYAFQSRDRVVADKLLANRQTTVVRQPPKPGQ